MFKTKKISIIVGTIASAITLSTFSGFAIDPTTESLSEQTIGVSSELSSSSEQTADSSTNVSKDFVNEKIIEDSSPKLIELSTPGDYRLVGAEKGISDSHGPNEIIVKTNDSILIAGDGKYNITLDNVNIGDKSNSKFIIGKNANVNLILVGKNFLKSNAGFAALRQLQGNSGDNAYGLKIKESSEGGSLDISGESVSIEANTLIINSGTIIAKRISADKKIVINRGTVTAKDILADNIIINKGTVTAEDILADNIIINSSDFNVKGMNKRTYK